MSTKIQKKPMVTEPKKPMIPKFEIPKWCSDRISNEDDYLRHSTYAGTWIPLDDAKTFELFRNGDTEGVFQFESEEMQTLLRQLKPNNFEDLIALHTLFRRGNMDVYTFIISKCSDVAIYYDFPEMESRLKDTEGLYVYQEQIMLLSQDLAGFTPSQSDELRKALGEKDIEKLSELKKQFIDGATKNGFSPIEKLEKIWQDWETESHHTFNKSHAASYTLIGYQMAYLKARFPKEFTTAIKQINKQ
ncbi:MAG: hypothetical protein FWG79_06890 [Bacteroidales bacterium]|nr:hypothetical protein [Bacteroidales bacterium]